MSPTPSPRDRADHWRYVWICLGLGVMGLLLTVAGAVSGGWARPLGGLLVLAAAASSYAASRVHDSALAADDRGPSPRELALLVLSAVLTVAGAAVFGTAG